MTGAPRPRPHATIAGWLGLSGANPRANCRSTTTVPGAGKRSLGIQPSPVNSGRLRDDNKG